MLKFINTFIFLLMLSAFSFTAYAETTTVTADDDSWGNATYDGTILTNVDGDYSFKTTRNDTALTATLTPNVAITVEKVVIPSSFTYNGKTYNITSVTGRVINNGSNATVKEVIVSEGIVSLLSQTFRSCTALESITLPSTLTEIGGNGFMGCTSLKTLDLPASLSTLGSQVFAESKALTTVTFNGNQLTTIPEKTFNACSALATINNFPNTITSIGSQAFAETAITEFTVPAGVTTIGNSAFNNAKALKTITFKGNVSTIGTTVFRYSTMNEMIFEGDTAPSFGSFGEYSGTGILVYYPEISTGYDDPAFRALFTKATFVQRGRYNTVHINISPGRDETELNVSWFGVVNVPNTYLQIAPRGADDTFPTEGVLQFEAVQADTTEDTGLENRSNKATATGLEPNKEYVYRVGDGTDWGHIYTYNTRDYSSFDFLFTTDAHIGVKTPEIDAAAWSDTLDKALSIYPKANLMLSGGDQADKGTSYQYNNFFAPQAMRNLATAGVGGSNHDDVRKDFKHYFNFPNLSDTYGITDICSNYYFTYGDALFMVLNKTNSRHEINNHTAFIRETVAANPDYKWRFVMFHHSIFSSYGRYPLGDNGDIDQFRHAISVIFTEQGIDAAFMGHDHGYTRTPIMNGMDVIESPATDSDGRIINANGVQYITGNSPTGNKFYGLANPLPYWSKVVDIERTLFTGISIRGNTMTITTYETAGMTPIDSVTISKEYALSETDAQILLTADDEVLGQVNPNIQLTLTPKSGLDLQGAEIVYECTEDGIISVNQNGIVTIQNIPDTDKSVRIWARVTIGGQEYITNAVEVTVNYFLPEISILKEQIVYKSVTDGQEMNIPTGANILPADMDSLIVDIPIIKNVNIDKNITVMSGLYNKNDELVSLVLDYMGNADIPLGEEYKIPLALEVPDGIPSGGLYVLTYFWYDEHKPVTTPVSLPR